MTEYSIDYNKRGHLPDKKNPLVMKTCFSEGKLMKQYGNPPVSKRTPLSNNSPISEQFFHDPLLSKFKKQEPPSLILGGVEETMLL